jgi:hypothetical protein
MRPETREQTIGMGIGATMTAGITVIAAFSGFVGTALNREGKLPAAKTKAHHTRPAVGFYQLSSRTSKNPA